MNENKKVYVMSTAEESEMPEGSMNSNLSEVESPRLKVAELRGTEYRV